MHWYWYIQNKIYSNTGLVLAIMGYSCTTNFCRARAAPRDIGGLDQGIWSLDHQKFFCRLSPTVIQVTNGWTNPINDVGLDREKELKLCCLHWQNKHNLGKRKKNVSKFRVHSLASVDWYHWQCHACTFCLVYHEQTQSSYRVRTFDLIM